MTLGDVFRLERSRLGLSADAVAHQLDLDPSALRDLEAGTTPIQPWAQVLADLAIHLKTPMARLVSATGRSAQAAPGSGGAGRLIRERREALGLSLDQLGPLVGRSAAELLAIEEGGSPIEQVGPILLKFAEAIDQPVFNLLYPCGLSLDSLETYP